MASGIMKEQQNNRGNNNILVYKDKEHTLAEWSEITGVPYDTLWARIKKGWSVEKSLTQPSRGQKELIWTHEKAGGVDERYFIFNVINNI